MKTFSLVMTIIFALSLGAFFHVDAFAFDEKETEQLLQNLMPLQILPQLFHLILTLHLLHLRGTMTTIMLMDFIFTEPLQKMGLMNY